MPDSDLILNVRQVAGYPNASSTGPSDSVLIQQGGLGGPYASISPSALVETALSTGGVMSIAGALSAQTVNGGSATFSNAAVGLLTAQTANLTTLSAIYGTLAGAPIATTAFVSEMVAGLQASTVWSFNGRRGDICLWINDIVNAGGAPQFSPVFGGTPLAPTPDLRSCNSRIATTAFVHHALVCYIQGTLADLTYVQTFNGRSGDVVLTFADVEAAGAIAAESPVLTGVPTTPTPPLNDSSGQIANTQFVNLAISGLTNLYAPIVSPAFSGLPSAPTAPPGTSNAQLATTAFVMAAVTAATAGVATWNGRTGAVVLESADITDAGGALLNSPAFTGTPTSTTAPLNDDSARIATTAFVMQELGGASVGVMSFNGRGGAVILEQSDITSAGGAILASPAFSGVPTAPTATSGTSTQQIATTAFVMSAITGGSVLSFNGRTGAVSLQANDVSAVGGLINPNAILTGTPTAPTASQGTSNTQIATTAFVTAAIAAISGVSSFNGRLGAVTLTSADLTGAGGALQSSLANYLPLAGGTVTGNTTFASNAQNSALVIAPTVAGNAAQLTLQRVGTAPAAACQIVGMVGANARWVVQMGNGAVESGGGTNSGSDFLILNYNDAGALIGTPFQIARSSGWITINNALVFNSAALEVPGGAFAFGFSAPGQGSANNTYGAVTTAINGVGNGNLIRSSGNPAVVGLTAPTANVISAYLSGTAIVQWSTTACDARIKRDLKPAQDALTIVRSLPVYSCVNTLDNEPWDFTIVADQVRDLAKLKFAYMPPPPDGGYGSLHPLHLIATLWRAVQQLTDRVQALEARA